MGQHMAIDHLVQMDAELVADQEAEDNPALFDFVIELLAREASDIRAGVIDESVSVDDRWQDNGHFM